MREGRPGDPEDRGRFRRLASGERDALAEIYDEHGAALSGEALVLPGFVLPSAGADFTIPEQPRLDMVMTWEIPR